MRPMEPARAIQVLNGVSIRPVAHHQIKAEAKVYFRMAKAIATVDRVENRCWRAPWLDVVVAPEAVIFIE